MNKKKNISGLHLITHPCEDFCPFEQAQKALEGGCDWVQLRMKKYEADEIISEAKKISSLKLKANFRLIINDHPELALQSNADGVHLGKHDVSPREVRKMLGDDFIIGGTANTIEDIEGLAEQGVDYVGLGPFRFTETKENLSPVLGLEGYLKIFQEMSLRNINVPVIGIGGVVYKDIPEMMKTGLHGLAVSSAILKSSSTADETRKWLKAIQQSI